MLVGALQMDIRNNYDNLKQLIGTQSTTGTSTSSRSGAKTSSSNLDGDEAQVSSAANMITMAASSSDVRTEKVQSVQSALEAGTYNIDASAVASKVIDHMLGKSA
jgi:flagellar biosynthesis anti-sigma factor FlgM